MFEIPMFWVKPYSDRFRKKIRRNISHLCSPGYKKPCPLRGIPRKSVLPFLLTSNWCVLLYRMPGKFGGGHHHSFQGANVLGCNGFAQWMNVWIALSCEIKGTTRMPPTPRNTHLIRVYEGI